MSREYTSVTEYNKNDRERLYTFVRVYNPVRSVYKIKMAPTSELMRVVPVTRRIQLPLLTGANIE